jgi:hypothetical protein
MKRVVEDIAAVDSQVGALYEEGQRAERSSDSSRRTHRYQVASALTLLGNKQECVRYHFKLHWEMHPLRSVEYRSAFGLICSRILKMSSLMWFTLLLFEDKISLLMQCVEPITDLLCPEISLISGAVPRRCFQIVTVSFC